MTIFEIRKHLAERSLSKDSTSEQDGRTFSFVSFPALADWLRANLPKGVSYHVQISHAGKFGSGPSEANALVGSVYVEGEKEPIHSESMLMPLYANPLDAAGAVTMLKKVLIMSMFDIIPNDSTSTKQELDRTVMKALLKVVEEHGLAEALERGMRLYDMTDKAIQTLREKAAEIAEQKVQEASSQLTEGEEAVPAKKSASTSKKKA